VLTSVSSYILFLSFSLLAFDVKISLVRLINFYNYHIPLERFKSFGLVGLLTGEYSYRRVEVPGVLRSVGNYLPFDAA
jgi:hypothetical protein